MNAKVDYNRRITVEILTDSGVASYLVPKNCDIVNQYLVLTKFFKDQNSIRDAVNQDLLAFY
jgi:hypothetical protein